MKIEAWEQHLLNIRIIDSLKIITKNNDKAS